MPVAVASSGPGPVWVFNESPRSSSSSSAISLQLRRQRPVQLDLMRGDLQSVEENGGAAGSHSGGAERGDYLSEGVMNGAMGADSRSVDELFGYHARGVCG
jgi:hypothetical protein